ncbi:hypothetical protein HPB50_024056 [Hyalomma asiaticum]|uniref:Uncharacterized protein n=1 Tax=Hyalomma asiaticum TaxID=266040 RepID=A0ACB7SQ86_HYAAI|nr:hypothetical protein HPB50_024056 [Hyalomma asiaticum]
MSPVRCLLMVVLLAWNSGVPTSVNSQPISACGKMCGGFSGSVCVEECHCVYYPGDYGLCLPHWMNETDLPPE